MFRCHGKANHMLPFAFYDSELSGIQTESRADGIRNGHGSPGELCRIYHVTISGTADHGHSLLYFWDSDFARFDQHRYFEPCREFT